MYYCKCTYDRKGTGKGRVVRVNDRAIPVIGRRGPNVLTFSRQSAAENGEAVSLARKTMATPGRFPVIILLGLIPPQGYSVAGRIREIKNSYDLMGNRTIVLPAFSILLKLTTLPRAQRVSVFK
jgi:hypothetical protein